MKLERYRLRMGRPALYLAAVVVLALFCLVGIGLWTRGQEPPASATPEVAFVIPTAGAPPVITATAACPAAPAGWLPYTVQPGDTLSELAARFQISQGRVMRANCLASPDLLAGLSLYLPPLPTPTPCPAAPAGWTRYTVQSGDTLSGLATARGTTIEEVMRVNCLTSDVINIGQSLWLPLLPTATPTSTPTTTPTPLPPPPAPATQPLAGPGLPTPAAMVPPGLPTPAFQFTPVPPTPPVPPPPSRPTRVPRVLLPAGVPNASPTPGAVKLNSWATACGTNTTLPPTLAQDDTIIEVGERIYFFACNFTHPISATITQSDGLRYPVDVLPPTFNRLPPPPYFRDRNTVKAVIEWSALPTLTVTGTYTLSVWESGNPQPQATRIFSVEEPRQSHILVVPPAGPPGTTFMVYYVNFTPSLTLTFDLYSEAQPGSQEAAGSLYARDFWRVPITRSLPISSSYGGWARRALPTQQTARAGIYAIGYEGERPEEIRQPDWLFWLRP